MKYPGITLPLLAVVCLSLPVTATAGDEEMLGPYTRFDPETGRFLPIDDQGQGPQRHGPAPADPPAADAAATPGETVQEKGLTALIAGGVILIITGVVLTFVRRTGSNNERDTAQGDALNRSPSGQGPPD
jgi:hypothetical protein